LREGMPGDAVGVPEHVAGDCTPPYPP
jgi:hypothetical protein